MNTNFSSVLRGAIAALILSLTFPGAHAAEPPPNVILILADDLGATDLGCYGSHFYETPNIDAFAKKGMRFTQAYSSCTVCSPTRASILTGKYPARLHITDWIAGHVRPFAKLSVPDWTMRLPLEEPNIARLLKGAGYATASIGKWHLGEPPFYPEHQGFDVNIAGGDKGQPPSYFSPYKIPTLKDGPDGEFLSDRLTSEACAFIEAHKGGPFFLYLPHFAVHTPLMAKPGVIARYKAKADPTAPQKNPVYAGLIESLDESVGVIMAKLAELHLSERTLVIFASDNGGLIGPTSNVPLRAGKGSAYEGGVRVPLMAVWPGKIAPGSQCEVPVISMDLYPTFLGAARVSDAPDHISDGASLLPLLTEGATSLKRDELYWHYPHYHPGGATPYSAVRKGDWKLIEFYEDQHVELYDLKADPSEARDLAAGEPARVQALKALLEQYRKSTGAQLPTLNPAFDAARDSAKPARARPAIIEQ